ncbi:MAG: hypothetical protein LR015_10140 [Verrucomicrobia bacterium]|nr:hypothetical protein [Verrucomicrobiota bacterium]
MKFRISGTTDPLRLALALLVLALLLPLALLIWFFIKSVQAERTLARQQLVTAYRSQVMINVGEAVQNWQNMQQDLLERARDPRNRITLHWLRQSNIQAVMLVDRQGRMGFPVNDAAQSGMVRFPVHLEELRTSLPSLGEDASLWLAAIDQVQQSLEAATDDPRLVLGFMMRVTELLPEPLVEIRSMLLDWWQQQFFFRVRNCCQTVHLSTAVFAETTFGIA